MPHVLNVWMYEYCSEVDKDIACRIDNRILRICNWFVVGTKPKFEKFMNRMFSKVVIEIDSSNKDVEKNETHGDDLGTPKEHPKDVSEKCNTICGDFTERKLPDLILPTNNVEDRNELQESTNDSSTDASQESIDNIIAGISTPFVVMKMKSVSPTEINDNECQIHDTQFQSILPEAKMGKQHAIKTCAPRNRKRTIIFSSPFTTKFGLICKGKESTTIEFPRKHLFDGYLISHDMPTGLIEEYCDWIVEGLLKFLEKK
ncbi:hypothetical protein FXO38_14144 [Capsicum annuum]|nr:hypothetical protein FXO38_14144 [Capsicum annuum]